MLCRGVCLRVILCVLTCACGYVCFVLCVCPLVVLALVLWYSGALVLFCSVLSSDLFSH
eukprot:COSAG06_NODE_42223_length_383_cov_7.573944_1_plen_58_part_10